MQYVESRSGERVTGNRNHRCGEGPCGCAPSQPIPSTCYMRHAGSAVTQVFMRYRVRLGHSATANSVRFGSADAMLAQHGLEVGTGDADILGRTADVPAVSFEGCEGELTFQVGDRLVAQLALHL